MDRIDGVLRMDQNGRIIESSLKSAFILGDDTTYTQNCGVLIWKNKNQLIFNVLMLNQRNK